MMNGLQSDYYGWQNLGINRLDVEVSTNIEVFVKCRSELEERYLTMEDRLQERGREMGTKIGEGSMRRGVRVRGIIIEDMKSMMDIIDL
jgi:hypothetical protein